MPVPSNVRSRYRGYSSVGFLFQSSLQRVGRNICIYNIVYVYRTAVDGLSVHMFGGFHKSDPPFHCIVGVDVPEPSTPVPVCKSSTYGDWEDPACGGY